MRINGGGVELKQKEQPIVYSHTMKQEEEDGVAQSNKQLAGISRIQKKKTFHSKPSVRKIRTLFQETISTRVKK